MTLRDDHALCRAIAHQHGANFSVGFRFLPEEKRRAVYAAYAWCRIADDIADDDVFEGVAQTNESKLRRLGEWELELDACYVGRPNHAVTRALADVLPRFDVPKSAFLALVQGCRQDLSVTRYGTFEELLHYCDLVASSIADISLAIFGYRTPAALEHGRSLATALQLTNVTRDVGDDLQRDRIYLPQEELRRFGVTEAALRDGRATPELRALIDFQIDRAEGYFQRAEPLIHELDFDARFPTVLMGGIYATVLARLRRDPFAAVRPRISLSKREKITAVLRRVFRPHFV